ncbi:MAG: WYL domain-containing protein [Propionibacteriaceae bacterium]|nr:WYL domain-containing protein [Propionibacteriaceae bacterium]
MRRSERLHALTESLRRSGNRGRTAEQLATEFEVSVRTIKRDLAALEASGLPLWSRPGPGGGYGLLSRGALPPVTLTDAQALSLLAAVAAAPDAPYSDLAAAAVRKIMDVLDPNMRARVDQLASRVWVNPAVNVSRVIRSACEQAMTEQRVLRIDYVAADSAATRRDIEPILFANTNGTWYLIGWCRLRDAVRWFSVSRIRRASVTRVPCTGHTVAEIGTPPPTATSVGINCG